MSIKKLWKLTDNQIEEVQSTKDNYKLRHGMLASIPLNCKGDKCPFLETCNVSSENRIYGERCLQEISAIVARFEDLCLHFGINVNNDYIEPKDVVDVSMIRDVVDLEIQILRAENKIAIDGDFMAEHIAQVDKACNAYYEDVIHPASEYKLRLIDARAKILSKLNSTRKDKSIIDIKKENHVDKAIQLIEKVKKKLDGVNLDEIDFDTYDLNTEQEEN